MIISWGGQKLGKPIQVIYSMIVLERYQGGGNQFSRGGGGGLGKLISYDCTVHNIGERGQPAFK